MMMTMTTTRTRTMMTTMMMISALLNCFIVEAHCSKQKSMDPNTLS